MMRIFNISMWGITMKKRKWIIVSAAELILMLADGLLTYINTPDLSLEGNPLVAKLGLGWEALFIANAIGFALFLLLARCAFNYQYEVISAKGLFDYYMKLLYGEEYKISWFFYKFAKNKRAVWAFSGYVLVYTLLAGRAVLVVDWLFFTFDATPGWWNFLENFIPFLRLDIWIALIIMLFLMIYWIIRGYRYSNKMISQQKGEQN